MDAFKFTARAFIENELTFGTPLHTICTLIANDVASSVASSDGAVNLEEYWTKIPKDTLINTWRYHLATILSNQMKGWKDVIIALGDTLLRHGLIEASHFCFMVGGCSISSSRIALVGCDHSIAMHYYLMTDIGIESFILTEAFEWAKRKGNPHAIISSLQPLKLLYSSILADLGYCEQALEFISSIKTCLMLDGVEKIQRKKKSSSSIPSISEKFLQELEVMEDRLLLQLGRHDSSADCNLTSLQTPFSKIKLTFKGISIPFTKDDSIPVNPDIPSEVHYGEETPSSSPLMEGNLVKTEDTSTGVANKDVEDDYSYLLSYGHNSGNVKNNTNDRNDNSNLRRPASAPIIRGKTPSVSPERNYAARVTDTITQPSLVKSPSTAPLSMKAIAESSASNQIPKSPDSAPTSGKSTYTSVALH